MNGKPFRIAAAGLGTALVASIVAGVSHFRTESRLLARSERSSIPAATLAAVNPPPERPAPVERPAPRRTDPGIASTLPPLAAGEVVASTISAARPDKDPPARPALSVVSNLRRKKEFVELPPPPEFLDEPDPTEQLVATPLPVRELDRTADPRLFDEIAGLRREFEWAAQQQRLERELERDRHARELAAISTDHRLAALQSSIEELKASQLDRRIAALPTAPPLPVLERRVPQVAEEPAFALPPAADNRVMSQPSAEEGRFDFRYDNKTLCEVLADIGERGAMNLVVSPDVGGLLTAAWKSVTPQEALEAVRLAHDLSVEPKGAFLLVSTSREARGRAETSKNTLVQMFRPLYISGRDLRSLIEPLLTPGIGRIAVTEPQALHERAAPAGGADSLAQPDAVIVVDYPEVIDVVTRTIAEVDVPAPHVELEATILDVLLSGRVKHGVGSLIASGEFSRRPGFVRLDDPQATLPCDSCCQTCDYSSSEMVDRLKLWTDVKLVSTARLLVLNKQPAALEVGSETICLLPTGMTAPSAAMDGGMRLFVRPFVSADHLVRLEVSPEALTSRTQPMNTRRETFASVATNVAVPNGGSLVLAGLSVDQSVAPSALFQGFGRLKRKHRDEADRAVRRELVIMITPRVVPACGPVE